MLKELSTKELAKIKGGSKSRKEWCNALKTILSNRENQENMTIETWEEQGLDNFEKYCKDF